MGPDDGPRTDSRSADDASELGQATERALEDAGCEACRSGQGEHEHIQADSGNTE